MVAPSNPSPMLIASDGHEFPVDNSAAPIRGAEGETMGVVLMFRDISDRRATEKLLEAQAAELRQRAQLLKEADEKKDQFLRCSRMNSVTRSRQFATPSRCSGSSARLVQTSKKPRGDRTPDKTSRPPRGRSAGCLSHYAGKSHA